MTRLAVCLLRNLELTLWAHTFSVHAYILSCFALILAGVCVVFCEIFLIARNACIAICANIGFFILTNFAPGGLVVHALIAFGTTKRALGSVVNLDENVLTIFFLT